MGMSITPDVAEPAIVQSAAFGFERIVDLLLRDLRAAEMVFPSNSLTLEYAAANAHEGITGKLSKHYFTRKAEDGSWRSVWFASVSSKELKIVEIISEYIDANSQPYERYDRNYALAFAVKGGDLDIVSFILENDLYDDCEYALSNCLEELENEIDDGTRAAMLDSLLRLGRGNEIKLKEIIRRCIGRDRFYEVNPDNKLIRTFFESKNVHEYLVVDDPDYAQFQSLWHTVCNNLEDLFFYLVNNLLVEPWKDPEALSDTMDTAYRDKNFHFLKLAKDDRVREAIKSYGWGAIGRERWLEIYEPFVDEAVSNCRMALSANLPIDSLEMKARIYAMAYADSVVLVNASTQFLAGYNLFLGILRDREVKN